MTTKEQERKALAQIMKIVEGLGEGSYIGTAFEGCWEIAEQNIENDWACSMKDRAETAEKKLETIEQKYEHLIGVKNHLEKSRDAAQEKAASNFQEALNHAQRERELEAAVEQQKQDQLKAVKAIDDLADKLKQKDLEIIKLKARLFDLMNA